MTLRGGEDAAHDSEQGRKPVPDRRLGPLDRRCAFLVSFPFYILTQASTGSLIDLIDPVDRWRSFFVVVGGLALLPLAAFAGATSEAVTDLTIRRLIKATSNRRTFAFILGQPRAFKLCVFWRAEFLKAAKDCRLLEQAEVKESDRGFAVGMLYGSGQSEAIAWAESHYSTFIFFSNLATLAVIGQIYVLVGGQKDWFASGTVHYWIIALGFLFYAFSSLSLLRYLYSYQMAFRQAAITLNTGKANVKPDAHNPATVAHA